MVDFKRSKFIFEDFVETHFGKDALSKLDEERPLVEVRKALNKYVLHHCYIHALTDLALKYGPGTS